MHERGDAGAAFSYDVIAEFYDDDMGRNVGGEDVAFYVDQCAAAPGPVLELGCGTGRITLALVRAGNTVIGIDLWDVNYPSTFGPHLNLVRGLP